MSEGGKLNGARGETRDGSGEGKGQTTERLGVRITQWVPLYEKGRNEACGRGPGQAGTPCWGGFSVLPGHLPRPQTSAVPTLPHQPPLRGLGGVDAVELLQHVTKVAVGRLVGLPNHWLLFLSGPLRHGVLGAWEEGGRGH